MDDEDEVIVGAVVSMVTDSAEEVEVTVPVSRVVVDIAVMLYVPAVRAAVVHCQVPVVLSVTHALPVDDPFAKS